MIIKKNKNQTVKKTFLGHINKGGHHIIAVTALKLLIFRLQT